VVEVARDLASWDAVDAGIFVCDKSVVETAEHALAAGEGSWNAVKRRWIEQGRRLDAIDLNGAFWVDVDTPQDARRAERLLVVRAASKPQDGFVSRTLNRPLSRRVSLLLVRKGVSPTSVTVATFVLALAAAALSALGAYSTLALAAGGLLVQFASVVDGCDGEVARATLRRSRFGALLDTLLDRLADAVLLVALAWAAGLGTTTWAVLVAAAFASLFVPYVKAAYESTTRAAFPATRVSYGRDARLLTIALCTIALQPLAALIAVATASTPEAVARSALAIRSARLVDRLKA
jgi:CDP-L-myo-inositol myo-inositolphosphotransferase